MYNRTKQTAATLAAVMVLGILATGCERSITGPDARRDLRSRELAQHDDDPAECRSGYQIIGGRVVCN